MGFTVSLMGREEFIGAPDSLVCDGTMAHLTLPSGGEGSVVATAVIDKITWRYVPHCRCEGGGLSTSDGIGTLM